MHEGLAHLDSVNVMGNHRVNESYYGVGGVGDDDHVKLHGTVHCAETFVEISRFCVKGKAL